jgi:hypothetical protein
MRTYASTSFLPRVERLESRVCLSCTVDVRGSMLRIIGDGGANSATVTDDGEGGVVATCNGGAAVTASGIRRITIDTKGGNDTVNVNVTGELTSRLNIDLVLGAGNDVADLNFAAISDELRIKADLGSGDDLIDINLDQEIREDGEVDIDVRGQDGADQFILSVNEVRAGAELNVRFDGGRGNDTLDVRLGDPVDEDAEIKIDARGGDGNDALTVDATTFGTGANIGEGAEVEVRLDGGRGNDNLNVSFEGEVDGQLELRLDGGDGNDTVVANVTVNAGSTGQVEARVNGGRGNDNLTLNVFDLALGSARVKAKLDGGAGFDTCVSTPNVEEKNCEA